jgi:hypothetical protein
MQFIFIMCSKSVTWSGTAVQQTPVDGQWINTTRRCDWDDWLRWVTYGVGMCVCLNSRWYLSIFKWKGRDFKHSVRNPFCVYKISFPSDNTFHEYSNLKKIPIYIFNLSYCLHLWSVLYIKHKVCFLVSSYSIWQNMEKGTTSGVASLLSYYSSSVSCNTPVILSVSLSHILLCRVGHEAVPVLWETKQ